MRGLSFLFFYSTTLTVAHGATIRHPTGPDSIPSSSFPNVTIGTNVDPRFSLQPHYTTTRLPATAILMNTVTLLAEAADLDFNGYINWNRHATFTRYPAVIIDLQLKRSRDPVHNFLLIWALYEAAWDMVAKNKFFVSDFDVVWRGKVVANLRYKKATQQELLEIGGVESKNNETASLAYLETAGGSGTSLVGGITRGTGQVNTTVEFPLSVRTSNEDVLTLHVQYLSNARDLPIFSVFMAVLAALKDNAYYAPTDRVYPFSSSTPGFDTQLSILRNEPPITTPPFFERTHITHTIRLIPGFMLEERKIAEVAFSFRLGNNGQVDLFT